MYLSKFFSDRKNKRVLILTRGYKGRLEKSTGLLKSDKRLGFNPLDFGDEALLLAKNVHNACVAVGRDRVDNLRRYFSEVSPDIVILDDGHQHLKLKRNLNIVLFDALLPLSSYKVAPVGYLREGMTALSAADIVVINRVNQAEKLKVRQLESMILNYAGPSVPIVKSSYRAVGFCDKDYKKVKEKNFILNKKVVCFAGIANPDSFFKLVEELGGEIVDQIVFSDHFNYSSSEIESIVRKAESLDALCITTEKDIVKVRSLSSSKRIFYLEVGLEFNEGEGKLIQLLNELV